MLREEEDRQRERERGESGTHRFARSCEPNLLVRGQSSRSETVPIAMRPPASSSKPASDGSDGAKMGTPAKEGRRS